MLSPKLAIGAAHTEAPSLGAGQYPWNSSIGAQPAKPARAADAGWRLGVLRRGAALALGLMLVLGTAGVRAAAPPAAVRAAWPEARLAGQGDMRWLGFKLYAAQLWTPARSVAAQTLPQTPFALDLRYATRIAGSALAERSTQEITRLGWGDAQQRQRWHEAMARLFPNVASGDRLTGLHTPGQGAQFFLNDRLLGSIDDPVFSQAFFAIWLDPRTVAPGLRQALLRNLQPAGSAR